MNRYEHLTDRDFLVLFFINEHDLSHGSGETYKAAYLAAFDLEWDLNRRFSQEQLETLATWTTETHASTEDMVKLALDDYDALTRAMTPGA